MMGCGLVRNTALSPMHLRPETFRMEEGWSAFDNATRSCPDECHASDDEAPCRRPRWVFQLIAGDAVADGTRQIHMPLM